MYGHNLFSWSLWRCSSGETNYLLPFLFFVVQVKVIFCDIWRANSTMAPWISKLQEVQQPSLPPALLPYCDILIGNCGFIFTGYAVTCLGIRAEEAVCGWGKAMALGLNVFNLFYKFKVLVLVTLFVMVLWTTFSYLVDTRQEIAKAKSMVEFFRKVTSLDYSQKEEKIESTADVPMVKSFQGPCPALSPYLRKWWCFPLLSDTLIYCSAADLGFFLAVFQLDTFPVKPRQAVAVSASRWGSVLWHPVPVLLSAFVDKTALVTHLGYSEQCLHSEALSVLTP